MKRNKVAANIISALDGMANIINMLEYAKTFRRDGSGLYSNGMERGGEMTEEYYDRMVKVRIEMFEETADQLQKLMKQYAPCLEDFYE